MLQFMTTLMSYAIVFLCFFVQHSNAKYPVDILDKKLKFSPKLFGVSTIVYNNELYAYGGQTALSFVVSNHLYKYSFGLDNRYVSMDTVYQASPGPNCTSCGAVMINADKMLILTHENASKNDSASAEQAVKPYTFDFITKEWSVPTSENLPRYNAGQKHIFTMRRRHNTILGSDGCIYVVGGTNFYDDTLYMQESWYYDPRKNEYGVLSDNRVHKTRAHSSIFNLPNGNIGVLFGYDESFNYYMPSEGMSIINISTKSWEVDPINLNGKLKFGEGEGEGITVQTDSNNNYAYFFGGRQSFITDIYYNNRLDVLNLKTNSWLTTTNEYEIGVAVRSRYFASSAIINDTFIAVFGTLDESNANEVSDLDIASLPRELTNSNEIPPENVTITWKSQLSQHYTRPSRMRLLMEHSTFHITLAVAISFLIFIIFLFFSKVSVDKSTTEKKFPLIPSLKIKQRAGELATTELYRILVQVICVLIFGGALGYLSYNTANSSISETVQTDDVDHQVLPDIRFCYSGYQDNNASIAIPRTRCEYEYTLGGSQNCTESNIIELSKSVHMPSFPKQIFSTKCYMYVSSNDSMLLDQYNPTALFSHVGGAYTRGEAVYVQFYEPEKNPNRVLFLDEDLDNLGIEEMDRWKDSERRAGTSNQVMDQILIAFPESEISVQFEVVHRKKINPYHGWNYFGAFPQYIESTELHITHSNDVIEREGEFLLTDPETKLGMIRVSPKDFKKRIITEKRDTTIITVLGTAGGVASVLFTAYSLLFGVKPSRPWGFVHRTNLITFQEQKKLRQLESYFDVKEVKGIPLVTPVHERYADLYAKNVPYSENLKSALPLERSDSKIENIASDFVLLQNRVHQLEGRNQILELVLRAYYIDVEIFQQLDRARQNRITQDEALKNQQQSQANDNSKEA